MTADQQHAARLKEWETQQKRQQNMLEQQRVALQRLEKKAEADSQRVGEEVAGFLEKLSQEAAAAQQHNKNMPEVEAALEDKKKMKRLQEICNALVAENRSTRERIEKLESTCLCLQRALSNLQATTSASVLGHLEHPTEKASPVHALQEEVLDLRERLSKLEFLVPHLVRMKPEPSSCNSSGRLSATSPARAPHQSHLVRTTPNSPRIDGRVRPSPPSKPPCPDRASPESYGTLRALGKPPLPSSMLPSGPHDSPPSLATSDPHLDGPLTSEFDAMPHSAPMVGLGPIMRRVSEAGSGASKEDRRMSGAGELRRGSEAGSGVWKEDRRTSSSSSSSRPSPAMPHSYYLGEGCGASGLTANVRLPSKRLSWGGESVCSRSPKAEELLPKLCARPKTHRLGTGDDVRASILPSLDHDCAERFQRRATVAGEQLLQRQNTHENELELLLGKSTEAVHREELPSTASQLEKLRANAELYCASTHQTLVAGSSRPASRRSVSLDPEDMGGKMRAAKREDSILSATRAPSWRLAALSPWAAAHARTTPANSDDGLS
mmetsp:Transcript_902/g.2193  ORF Transcript_902/g.2193 Transcript_902/m.2193 type:complete len:551 (+) Transcript_902:166-1818(+)|eukprot:CAMPEP_0202382552 /NCGR_PEP_ID=MMETSP1127-20130417/43779_1 /ASSEMBLY_ACC=CAM_ASM_000462 /TAXON_ID=3047 /ORGANISM="Dunaliella tertiolecta, Strain CCMP1320" /LENGTH=550 /DNA_ID=CAMNT_0048981773 /DNA_START=149 /DNA_END=1801 /DNA_ORIENTATION=-